MRRAPIATSVVTGVLVAGAMAPSAPAASQEFGQAELRQLTVHSLPDTVAITGVALSSTGGVVVWSSLRNTVFVLRGVESWQELGKGSLRRPIAVDFDSNGDIEILDGDLQQILRFTADGELLDIVELPNLGFMGAAARSDDGWYLLIRATDDFPIYHIIPPNEVEFVAALQDHLHPPAESILVDLTSDDLDLLISYRLPPHGGFRLARDGSVTRFPGASDTGESRADARLNNWLAAPLVRIPSGYVQTVANLTRDERIVAMYDMVGNLVREVRLDLPIAFQGSRHQASLLAAVTRLEHIEIRLYQWHWLSSSHP